MFCQKKKKKERKKGTENVFEEIMAENFPNLKKACSTSLIIRECKSKPHKKKYHPTVVRMAAMKVTAFKKCC